MTLKRFDTELLMQRDKKNQMLPENSSSCVSTMMPINKVNAVIRARLDFKRKRLL